MTVYLPIGISGSGKSTLWRTKYPDSELLEADLIRKEVGGDVSCLDNEPEVWRIFEERYHKLLNSGKDIYLSEMHLSLKGIKSELRTILEVNPDYEVKILLLTVSNHPEICEKRVADDLANGVERSTTAGIKAKNGAPLIEDMSRRWKILVNSQEFKDTIDHYTKLGLDIEVIEI